jgi:NADH-quinone oxidoreductase subunit E
VSGPDANGAPAGFAFSEANWQSARAYIAKYPPGRQASAVLPLLDLAQRQCGGWLPQAALDEVARVLEMPPIKVYEVATFYTMFKLRPVGRHLVQLCRTTPCWLRGSDALREAAIRELGCGLKQTSADGRFTLVEVECLGACVNAPVVQIDDDFYEDLTPESLTALLQALRRGERPAIGSQSGRQCSAPAAGPTTLSEFEHT